MTGLAVSAPGKAFLCGEYAVTEGATAIVAAVDRRVVVRPSGVGGDGHPHGPEVCAAFLEAQEVFGKAAEMPTLDRRRLFDGGAKLGLGSSAAGAVAVAGAVAAHHGHDLDEPIVRERVRETALRAHERVAPNGSGADVVAAAHGGFVAFLKTSRHAIRVEPVAPPDSVILRLVWTGSPARTSHLLGKVDRLRREAPATYAQVMEDLQRGAETFASAFRRGRTSSILEATQKYHDAMGRLGKAAGVPIVDSRLESIARAAARTGGAAKPCGAGGGDVAVAFFTDVDDARRFARACEGMDVKLIEVGWGAPGVRIEPTGT